MKPKLKGPPGLPAVVIAELASEESEVHFARNGEHGLLLARSGGKWLTGPVFAGKSGRAIVEAQPGMTEVADAPDEQSLVALAAHRDHFLLCWTQRGRNATALWGLELGRNGLALGQPRLVRRDAGQVIWVQILAQGGATTVLWETPHEPGSDVHLAAWLPKRVGPAITVARQVGGWQAVANGAGAAVAYVHKTHEGRGQVELAEVNESGALTSAIALSAPQSAMADVQLAALRGRYVVAWTDAAAGQHRVMLSEIKMGGHKPKPARVSAPSVNEQALVTLIASEDRRSALLAWQNALGPSEKGRRIELSVVEPGSDRPRVRASLAFSGQVGSPHFVGDGAGFAALTLAPVRYLATPKAAPTKLPAGPMFVRFDERLQVRNSEPLRVAAMAKQAVGVAGIPQAVRDLDCQDGLCTALTIGKGAPALLALATLPVRRSAWLSPSRSLPTSSSPSATKLQILTETSEPLADFSAAKLADGRVLAAWVTHFAGSGRAEAPAGATLAYRMIAADGSLGKIVTLSKRAISIGGVKVVALPATRYRKRADGVALIGWAGPNDGSSQIFVTKIGRDGSKLRQKTLTKVKAKKGRSVANRVYDVDLAVDGREVICAWSDTRGGAANVYLVRANKHLERQGKPRRLSLSKAASSQSQLSLTGGKLRVTWSDAPHEGHTGGVFVATVEPKKLRATAEPRRISSPETPAHSPKLTDGGGGGHWLWWHEGVKDGNSTALRLTRLQPDGRPTGTIRTIRLAGTVISDAVMGCAPTTPGSAPVCRGVVAGLRDQTLQLGGFIFGAEEVSPLQAKALEPLPATANHDLVLGSTDENLEQLFFIRDDPRAGSKAQLLSLEW